MMHMLPDRLPWFVAGPLIGLLVLGLWTLASKPLGVSGAYMATMRLVLGLEVEVWRVWYFAGLAAGALVATMLGPGVTPSFAAYGALGQVLEPQVLIPVLIGAGALMGYGARWAGGCTSGHGLAGSALLSPASLAAAASLVSTAVLASLAMRALTGGAL